MDKDKPNTLDKYAKWLRRNHGVRGINIERTYYTSVTDRIKRTFEASVLWMALTKNLGAYDDEYLVLSGYRLLAESAPELVVKPFTSFLQKTYRKNVLENDRWPNEPDGGWTTPKNWYSRVNDLVRTYLVVKYIDGVEFLAGKIHSLCAEHGSTCRIDLEARQEGYYAAHVYARQTFEIPSTKWDTERIDVDIEVQITTQLQEVIRSLLHKYYESRRMRPKAGEGIAWQWDYRSDEFAANYLGHILHYVEGMIMDVREKQKHKEETSDGTGFFGLS